MSNNEVATIDRPRREIVAVQDAIPLFDTVLFEHMCRIAKAMAHASILPEHLKVKEGGQLNYEATFGNCLLVVNRARSWQMDPIAVAQCMSIVHGRECYEGKLIAAVVEAKVGLRLKYEWSGEAGTDGYGIRITNPDNPDEWVEGTVGKWKTKDRQGAVNWNWQSDPRKMLKNRGDREWCRMWRPALMLGVYSDDEMVELAEDARARRAQPVGLAARLTAVNRDGDQNGFSQQHVAREIGQDVVNAETGEITSSQPSRAANIGVGKNEEVVRAPTIDERVGQESGQTDETLMDTSETEAQPGATDKTSPEAQTSNRASSDDDAGAADVPSGQPPQPSSSSAQGGPSAPTGQASGVGAAAPKGGGATPDFPAYHRALARASQAKSLKMFNDQFQLANAWTTDDAHLETLRKIYAVHQRRLKGEFEGKSQQLVDELKALGAA